MASALFEFMPYGAPELIEGASQRLFRATAAGIALCVLVFLGTSGWMLVWPRVVEPQRIVVVPYRELAAPPPLTQEAPPQQIVVSRSVAPPAIGVPIPVPDLQAPPEQTIASQQEIAAATGSVEAGSQTLVVQPPPAEELPKLGDFVYVDELPELITDAAPRYPAMAREAEVEGEVRLRVLVGKDGRVADVHVDRSIPMLDQAAIEVAWTWVFKPALCNNRSVAVWIARKVRFSLRATPA